MLMRPRRGYRDHDHERPLQPPVPNVVRLIPPLMDPELPTPRLEDSLLHDHETQEITRLGPLQAYRLVAWSMGPEFASAWADWTAAKRAQERYLAFLVWQHQRDGIS